MPMSKRKADVLSEERAVEYPTYPDLEGKHVLITGGAAGIGLRVCRAFASQGSLLTIIDRDQATLDAVVAELGDKVAHGVKVDVTDEPAFVAALAAIKKDRPPVQVLIGNAGADPRYEGLDMTTDQWNGLFNLNVTHYFVLCRELVPVMVESGGGTIVLTSSHLAWLAKPKCIAYNATKAADIGLVRGLAEAYGSDMIRVPMTARSLDLHNGLLRTDERASLWQVNSVAPGWTMTERQMTSVASADDFEHNRLHNQALPVQLTPERLAQNYLFLASEASICLQRQTIVCDMGQTKL